MDTLVSYKKTAQEMPTARALLARPPELWHICMKKTSLGPAINGR